MTSTVSSRVRSRVAAELLDEILLALGGPAEAERFFEASVARRPARRLTLRGLDRARKEMAGER